MKFPVDVREKRAFLILFGGLILVIAGVAWVVRSPHEGGIPAPLRNVLEWNGHLGARLFSSARLTKGLPEGQHPTGLPRVNGDVGLLDDDEVALGDFEFRSDDQDPLSRRRVTYARIRAMPRTESTAEFKCIEGWSQQISYAGVRFSDFLREMGVTPGRGSLPYVALRTPDGEYYVSLDIESMLHPQTILAYEMNGKPLSAANGAPLRLVIPIKYGIKSLKRIGSIGLSRERPPDYWAERGYDWFAGL